MSKNTKRNLYEAGFFVALVLLGVVVRIQLQHIPNFSPVAALALFSGFFFRRWGMAIAVPLSVMAISDQFVGGYTFPVMVTVYTCMALPVAVRRVLRSTSKADAGKLQSTVARIAKLGTCALGASVVFFLATNFACWIFLDANHTMAGLLANYTFALPFFRMTLAGDLCFTFALFGSHALVTYLVNARQHKGAVAFVGQ